MTKGTGSVTGTGGGREFSANARGLAFSIASGLSFQGMNGFVRLLSGVMHPFEIAFFRNLFGLIVLAPLLWRSGLATYSTQRFPMHMLRAVLNLMAMLSAFYAISIEPLARFTALYFTAPLFATLGAIFILGERVRARRIVALGVGFLGALIVLRPGVTDISVGSLVTLFSATSWAAALIVIKMLARTESSLTITTYAATLLAPMALIASLAFWTWPTFGQLGILFIVGICGAAAQLTLSQAMRLADASLVLSADFVKLIWASAIGYVFFSQVPDQWTWIGGLVISVSVAYIAHRERKTRAGAHG